MKVNSINNNRINNRPSFKGYSSDPGIYAFRAQVNSAREAELFLNSIIKANRQDASSTNFITAFVNKLTYAGEILGLKSMKQAGEIMKTPQHKVLVRQVDQSVDAMLNATGFKPEKALNVVA